MAGSQWRVFPAPPEHKLPTLLSRYNFSTTEYTVYLTDLTRVWSESLDRKSIVRRALLSDTSIDPSEGPDQHEKLLQNLKSALNGDEHTTAELSYDEKETHLKLRLECQLPAPLQALVWCLDLSLASQDQFRSNIFVPCLTSLSSARSEIASLITLIKQKDHVIGRLTDKLRTAGGIDLVAVFPSAASTKLLQVNAHNAVLNSVKGLKKFDEDVWRESTAKSSSKNIKELCLDIFENSMPLSESVDGELYGEWWKKLGTSDQSIKQSLSPTLLPFKPNAKGRPSLEDMQTENTPEETRRKSVESGHGERLPPKEPAPLQEGNSNASETDDDLGNSGAKSENSPPLLAQSISQPRKLGILGGRKTKIGLEEGTELLNPPSETEHKPNITSSRALDETLNGVIVEAKPRGRLGKIGGRHLKENKCKEDVLKPKTETPGTSTINSTPSEQKKNQHHSEQGSKSPASPRETLQEMADRNRAQLKRELEAKRNAPVKKKRKF